MLYQQFDYTVAYFDDTAAINPDEYTSADIVTIGGYHPAGIYHSTSMRWICSLKDRDISQIINSHKEQSALLKNRQFFLDQGYTFQIKRMSETDYTEFKDLYENTTQKKTRAIRHNLADRILGRILVDIPVYCVGMYKDGKLESGLVFTIDTKNTAVVSFGAKQKFQEVRGGVGGTLEWELLKYCEEHKISGVDHGKNPNPVGLANKAGLFEFKARYGSTAYPEGRWVTTCLRNPDIVLSDLVFVTTINDQVGYVVISKEEVSQKKYITNEVANIKVLSMTEVVTKARAAF
jgi:hypothetical protein